MDKPRITASSTEEFMKILELFDKLPDRVKEDISNLSNGVVGLECTITHKWKDKQDIFLPKETTQICDFGDYIGVYCGDYFFKITGDLYKKNKFNYIFV